MKAPILTRTGIVKDWRHRGHAIAAWYALLASATTKSAPQPPRAQAAPAAFPTAGAPHPAAPPRGPPPEGPTGPAPAPPGRAPAPGRLKAATRLPLPHPAAMSASATTNRLTSM